MCCDISNKGRTGSVQCDDGWDFDVFIFRPRGQDDDLITNGQSHSYVAVDVGTVRIPACGRDSITVSVFLFIDRT